jgi:O-antigen ligase
MRLSKRFRRTLALLGLAIVVFYLLAIGLTWNGLLFPNFQQITLVLLFVCVGVWMATHTFSRWKWHRTPMDWLFVAWGVAFALSIAVNPTTAHRSIEAVWYMLLYMLLWYILADVFSNLNVRGDFVLLLTIFGGLQLWLAITQSISYYQNGGAGFSRPVGTFGNPNTLGAFLVVLIPFYVQYALTVKRRFERGLLIVISLLTLLVLAATFSRGAWIGVAVGLLAFGLLRLADRDLLSRTALSTWLTAQSSRTKSLVVVGILLIVVAGISLVGAVLLSLGIGGRGADLRTQLWAYALQMFGESPITGKGLFTYGYYLPTFWSIPPQQPHSHPHNVVLLVMAELGVLGLAVLSATVFTIWRKAVDNWRAMPSGERTLRIAASAALLGFAVHHLFDTPMMMPAIAVCGLLLLAILIVPNQPIPLQAKWRIVGHPIGTALLFSMLWLVGLWQSSIQARYVDVLNAAQDDLSYQEAATRLVPIVEADPRQPAYRLQLAYMWGQAATTDDTAIQPALEAYADYMALEPNNAVAWLNSAALAWQLGENDRAIELAQRAVELAPEWTLATQLLAYYEGGDEVTADAMVESIYAPNLSYFQYLRVIFTDELLPQLGWR